MDKREEPHPLHMEIMDFLENKVTPWQRRPRVINDNTLYLEEWSDCIGPPTFDELYLYRRKPREFALGAWYAVYKEGFSYDVCHFDGAEMVGSYFTFSFNGEHESFKIGDKLDFKFPD